MPAAVSLDDIRAARERIKDFIYHSPCPYSMTLSRLCGADVYCKFEHLQMTGSFKERGARNKLLLLGDAEKRKGVIAASAGNHALALAWHGRDLRIPVTVVMPKWAPLIKVQNCRSFGADVLFCGESYDDARATPSNSPRKRGWPTSRVSTTRTSSLARARSAWRFLRTCRTWMSSSSRSAAAG
jgi:threonine dehydratase